VARTKRKIDLATYNRADLLLAFVDRQIPCFSTTCNVDVFALRKVCKKRGYSFFITLSYVLSRSVNAIPELRHRLIDGELWEFDRVDPGYTILLEDNSFSFCDSMYFKDFYKYYRHALAQIESVKKSPDRTMGDKNHMFFISNVPWFSFTAFTHPYDERYGSIPVLTTGKYFEQYGKLFMPLAIQVHHGLVDGIHVGMLFEKIQQLTQDARWLLDKEPIASGL
jgi:chloramphenicol O-acetyltransferase type A